MSTRISARLLAGAIAALGGVVSTAAAHAPAPTFTLQGGQHLRVISGYLRDGPGTAVRGFVRRDPLWSGPVRGHLHITAYAATGEAIDRQATTWSGRFADSHGPPLPYRAELKVARADVARIDVAFAPGRHTASESFQ